MNVLTRALLVSFGLGAVSIVVLRSLVFGLPGASLAAFVAVAIITGVGFYYYQHVSGEDRQAAGDNLYYLGLLFTLLALILALFQLFVLDAGGTTSAWPSCRPSQGFSRELCCTAASVSMSPIPAVNQLSFQRN